MSLAAIKDVLDGASRELGATTRAGYFDIAKDAVNSLERSDNRLADIMLSAETAHLANILKKHLGKRIRVITDCGKARLSDDFHLPAIRIGIVDANEIRRSDDLPEIILWLAGLHKDDRSCVYVLCEPSSFDSDEAMKARLDTLGSLSIVPINEQELATGIERALDELGPDAVKTAADRSAARIARYAHEIITDELRALELRKQLLTDDLASARRPGSATGSDSTNRVRTIIQKNLQDAERAFKLKYDELNRNKSGEFQLLTQSKAAQVAAENMVHIELASKTETTETELDTSFTDDFVRTMKKSFKKQVDSDLQYLEGVKNMTFDQLNNILHTDGLAKIDPANIYALEPDPKLPLDSHFHIQKKYSGEITKDGPMQYFIALRDYTGMIMVLVGILAPLTLVATTPDAEPGSIFAFFNEVGGVVKKFRALLTFVTAVLVGAMLIYGFFDLRRRIPLKRIEEREKDIYKAKEAVEQEGRRMFNDASRDWVTQLGTYIRDLSTSIAAEIEQAVRSKTIQAAETQDEKRRKTAMAQASVDARLKGITLLERKLEPLLRRS